MTQEEKFINEVAPIIQKHAPKYGICVYSPIIAQFCLESGNGTSNKVKKILPNGTIEWRHNYAGLKWHNNRCAISNDYFEEGTAEQNADGTYKNITSKFFKFKSLEDCVIGYFQFINISAYKNLKGVTDPETYLKNIKEDKYATSIDYVHKNMNLIKKYDLTRFDPTPNVETKKFYRVQCGAFSVKSNANALENKLKQVGFNTYIKKIDGLYKVQLGAFKNKANAESLFDTVKSKGFDAFLTYC